VKYRVVLSCGKSAEMKNCKVGFEEKKIKPMTPCLYIEFLIRIKVILHAKVGEKSFQKNLVSQRAFWMKLEVS